MCTQVIDMMHGIAYLLIPGFLILSLLFFSYFMLVRHEVAKAGSYRFSRERRY